MYVTAKDFQENFNKYLQLVNQEDILITENGQTIATVSKTPKEPSTFEELRDSYIKTFGEPPTKQQEQYIRDLIPDNDNKTTSAVDSLCGLLAGKCPPDLDKKQIREMRLQDRYDSDNA